MNIPARSALRLPLSLLLAAALAAPAFASTYTRIDNSSTLDTAAAWNGTTPPPGSGDIAQWDGVTGNVGTGLAASVSWGEIQLASGQTSAVTIGSGGTVTLNGVGGIGIDLGNATANLVTTAGLDIAANQTWNIGTGRSIQTNGVIAGSATPTVTVDGGGTLIINAANTQTLNMVIEGGTLNFGGGCITATGGFFGGGNSTANGPGSVTFEDVPTLRATSNRNVAALTTSVQSNVTVSVTARLLWDTKNLDLNDGTQVFTVAGSGGTSTGGSGNIRFGFQVQSVANTYIPSMSVTNGTLDLESSGVTAGNNIYAGWVSATPFGGTTLGGSQSNNNGLILGANIVTYLSTSNPFGSGNTAANLTVSANGVLDMSNQGSSNYNVEVYALSGAGTVTDNATSAGTANLTVSGGYNSIFSGVIKNGSSGIVALSKTGTSDLTLTGVNTYTGATTITGGALAILSPGSLSTSSTITLSGTGVLAGNGTVGPVVVNSGGSISPGTFGNGVGTVGTLSASALTLAANSSVLLDLNNTGVGVAGVDWDQLSANGTVTISSFAGGDNTTVVEPQCSRHLGRRHHLDRPERLRRGCLFLRLRHLQWSQPELVQFRPRWCQPQQPRPRLQPRSRARHFRSAGRRFGAPGRTAAAARLS
jgi:autotransporter-associated beta strand protein